ncbi:MAG: hypothetical protein A3F91_07135 [Flavobacteria bacterium RIFCSPLOWO2_12_FULL_35_11]|nr:MAG: hypothetical protein A3F91_07135 [Flavobacteria bacterium RIFCSPLOWO2_12_FULL_35_11]
MATNTFIAFIRGINVSGCNKIKMTELQQLFIELDFKNVTTYIQSGNVVFRTNLEELDKIEQQIINGIKQTFGYLVQVIVLTKKSLETIYVSNPFLQDPNIDITKLHVTLLSNKPNENDIIPLNTLSKNEDTFIIIDKTIYLYCPNGYGKTPLNNNLFERKLKISATTRNWNTISKLVEISNL